MHDEERRLAPPSARHQARQRPIDNRLGNRAMTRATDVYERLIDARRR